MIQKIGCTFFTFFLLINIPAHAGYPKPTEHEKDMAWLLQEWNQKLHTILAQDQINDDDHVLLPFLLKYVLPKVDPTQTIAILLLCNKHQITIDEKTRLTLETKHTHDYEAYTILSKYESNKKNTTKQQSHPHHIKKEIKQNL